MYFSDLRMSALAGTRSNYKQHTHPYYITPITVTVQLGGKITGLESQGACRQQELIGGKQPVVN
jgi:hypothetical protein